jgi:hypothetical protein
MKVFTVVIDKGQWSDSSSWVSAVFDTREAADAYVEVIVDYNKRIMEEKPPYSEDDYYSDKLTEEQQEEYNRWEMHRIDANDFNFAKVEEYILNFPEPHFYEKADKTTETA